jgi:hypothetical protein
MAKKNNNWLIWIIALVALVALVLAIIAVCNANLTGNAIFNFWKKANTITNQSSTPSSINSKTDILVKVAQPDGTYSLVQIPYLIAQLPDYTLSLPGGVNCDGKKCIDKYDCTKYGASCTCGPRKGCPITEKYCACSSAGSGE